MSRVIWKYRVQPNYFDYMMPQHARFLDLQIQNGDPVMWFEVDPEAQLERRGFITVPTGFAEVPFGSIYLGTFQTTGPDGGLVFHTYTLQK